MFKIDIEIVKNHGTCLMLIYIYMYMYYVHGAAIKIVPIVL